MTLRREGNDFVATFVVNNTPDQSVASFFLADSCSILFFVLVMLAINNNGLPSQCGFKELFFSKIIENTKTLIFMFSKLLTMTPDTPCLVYSIL